MNLGFLYKIILKTIACCLSEHFLNSRHADDKNKKRQCAFDAHCLRIWSKIYFAYFTFSTIALKASGLFTARSASTLRLISIPALCRAPMSVE